ncbi:hypothetical protein TNCV_4796381 [Trichonephila clavipes]|uniref:Uncharacterized protein n=1 Tax=Trichonephila clavipes TaxID=2585209 RepID=A0A8X6RWG6_TRICX|nr:hypothetical protein TNCV_4796381 [Trichonephila clavipes]
MSKQMDKCNMRHFCTTASFPFSNSGLSQITGSVACHSVVFCRQIHLVAGDQKKWHLLSRK